MKRTRLEKIVFVFLVSLAISCSKTPPTDDEIQEAIQRCLRTDIEVNSVTISQVKTYDDSAYFVKAKVTGSCKNPVTGRFASLSTCQLIERSDLYIVEREGSSWKADYDVLIK